MGKPLLLIPGHAGRITKLDQSGDGGDAPHARALPTGPVTAQSCELPRGEWHCLNCLSQSNEKPISSKHGRVIRNTNVPKEPSNTVAVQLSTEKKVKR